jgi:TatD DNase family protein
MLIDIGVNLSNQQFKNRIPDVLERALSAGVEKIILTGTSVSESQAVVALCDKYQSQFPNMLYATVGIHPHEAKSWDTASHSCLKELASHSSVVAIGETGLDFNRNLSLQKDQELAFEAQLELATELRMPLFLHERDAAKRQLETLTYHRESIPKAVIHCFTGDKKTLFNYLDLDLYIGITGWICDERRGQELQKLVKNIPLDRLMVETDAPYLLPRNMNPLPKNRRNEPAFLKHIVKCISDNRAESEDIISQMTTATALDFFGLS